MNKHTTHSLPTPRPRSPPDYPALHPQHSPSTHPPDTSNTNTFPQFPPPHVFLHPDDANSKVLLAIGRAFLSVDNRAMTIKDLADMVLGFGLIAQNVSAASQAITTYIRTHLHRCDVQQDIPLLLRHVLSGTDADDHLLPALYSHSGGAQCSAHPENRVTNFRRGTMVWYLSRATGAPCPFARAGIRLSDYGDNTHPHHPPEEHQQQPGNIARDKKRAKMLHRRVMDQQVCGQKRKRSLRSCAMASTPHLEPSPSDSETDHDKPPPKVKLTLRLKPLVKSANATATTTTTSSSSLSAQTPSASITITKEAGSRHYHRPSSSSSDSDESDSDHSASSSMSVDDSESPQQQQQQPQQQPSQHSKELSFCLPPYPRRSISIPPYTPSIDGPYPCYPTTQYYAAPYRRSPSIAHSISSPPPESDDEDDDEDNVDDDAPRSSSSPRRNFYHFSDEDNSATRELEGDFDSEADGETLWESPGPRSPSAPLALRSLPDMKVKEEPRDLQGMLDAWDHFDSSLADAKVVEVIAQAAAVLNPETIGGSRMVKVESQHDLWDWEPSPCLGGLHQPHQQHHDEWSASNLGLGLGEETIKIKQEDLDIGFESLFPSVCHDHDSFELGEPGSERGYGEEAQRGDNTIKQRSKTAPASHGHVSTLFPGSLSPSTSYATTPQSVPVVPSTEPPLPSSPHALALPPPISPGAAALVQLIQALSVHSPTTPTTCAELATRTATMLSSPPSVLPTSLILTPVATPTPPPLVVQQPCVSPQEIRASSSPSPANGGAEGIVVHTCQPCHPPISATQIEGISVYQITLGPYLLLRRIDTDFVNLTPIVEWCGKGRGYPVLSTVPNATVVGRGWGSEKVCGVWVPLEVAQAYVSDLDTHTHSPTTSTTTTTTNATTGAEKEQIEGLNVFLSDGLVERFPSALNDFHRTNSSGRMLKQFGRWFESMVTSAAAVAVTTTVVSTTATTAATNATTAAVRGVLNPQKMIQGDTRQSWTEKEMVVPVPMTGAFSLGAGLVVSAPTSVPALGNGNEGQQQQQQQCWQSSGHRKTGSVKQQQEDRVDVTSPLSAKEQEIFQELCLIPGEEEEKTKIEVVETCSMDVEVTVEAEEEEEESLSEAGVVEGNEVAASPSPPCEGEGETQSPSSPSSSSDLDPETLETTTKAASPAVGMNRRTTRAATMSKTTVEKQQWVQERQEKQQALRRSKRVADALAAHSPHTTQQQQQQQQSRTRPRKRPGTRNTLS